MEIGKKIMDLRKKNGLSQEELAEKVGVARQTISKWELGETSPDLKQSKELSKIFKVSLDELTDNDIKDILVEVIKTSHDAEDSVGYVINNKKESVVYITDTGYINKKYFDIINTVLFGSEHKADIILIHLLDKFLFSKINFSLLFCIS